MSSTIKIRTPELRADLKWFCGIYRYWSLEIQNKLY